MSEYIVELRRAFHKIPELGFQEYETNALITKILSSLDVEYITNVAGTGVLVSFGSGHPHIAFRAEIDGLPICEENEVEYKSEKDGCMHACGHDAHIAVLIDSIIKTKLLFEKENAKGKVTFIFQPCEETKNQDGMSGGQLISEMPILADVDYFFAAHVESTLENGKFFIREGGLTAAIDKFAVDIFGAPGHGAYPHHAVDPIWLATNTVQLINTLESRTVNTAYPSVISVCTIEGGTAWNVIPEKVSFGGTIRTFNESEREKIHDKLRCCLETVKSFGGRYTLDISRGNPSVINSLQPCNIVKDAIKKAVGEKAISGIEIQMGGDDFSYYAQKKPSCYFYVGAKKDSVSRQHHSSIFDIDENVLQNISNVYLQIIRNTIL